MGAKTGAPLANKPARSPKSKSGGGAAGWFLFILKVSCLQVSDFTAVVRVSRLIAAADFSAHRCRSFHCICSRCRGEFQPHSFYGSSFPSVAPLTTPFSGHTMLRRNRNARGDPRVEQGGVCLSARMHLDLKSALACLSQKSTLLDRWKSSHRTALTRINPQSSRNDIHSGSTVRDELVKYSRDDHLPVVGAFKPRTEVAQFDSSE